MSNLVVPVCSITTTKRRRFFWAVWREGTPTHVPFAKPDLSDGGASTLEEAWKQAEERAGTSLALIDPLWARAWIRILRGGVAWPSEASRHPATAKLPKSKRSGGVDVEAEAPPPDANAVRVPESIWSILRVTRDVSEEELKAAYRSRVLETHPDQGGDEVAFRRVLDAYDEARRRLRKPKPKR